LTLDEIDKGFKNILFGGAGYGGRKHGDEERWTD